MIRRIAFEGGSEALEDLGEDVGFVEVIERVATGARPVASGAGRHCCYTKPSLCLFYCSSQLGWRLFRGR